MKKIVLFATALIALASCTSDEFVGDKTKGDAKGLAPISFAFDVPQATRATGATAAGLLGNQFIVYGEKGEAATGALYTADDATTDLHQLVFKNYVVNYVASSAYTTTSNTKDWEYVGLTQSYSTNVVPQAGETQTIKYWDYAATNYVFTAFSALQSDLSSGKVTVTKIQEKTTDNTVYDKGYTVTLAADADPTKLYFSNRVVINQGTGYDRNAENAYGGNVTFNFYNGVSQVRAAMYETVPGYDVVIDKFYYEDNAAPTFATMATAGTDKFYANVPNLTTDKAATLTVTYYEAGERLNQPKISTSGTANNYLALGTNLKAATQLGTTVTNAVYDQSDKSYTMVFPQESNNKDLKLKVDYTLKNTTTGETIKVKGATANVPAKYLAWKPNFKYTYIFKISDDTNGHTGPGTDPAGLYPITFDAAVIEAADGQAEYITTVSEPSITTFGVKANKYVHDGNEYEAGSDIYATFLEGSSVMTPTLGGSGAQHVNVYKVSSADATHFPVTEASVAEAIANPASITNPVYTFNGTDTYTQVTSAAALTSGTTYYKEDANSVAPGGTGYIQTVAVAGVDYQVAPVITAVNINSDASTNFTAVPAVVTSVPSEDGLTITQNALKLTGVKAGTYAVEYEASAAWTGTYSKVYKVIVVQ